MSCDEILERVEQLSPWGYVELTGGEPLLQKNSKELIDMLDDKGYRVLCETNGTIDLAAHSSNAHYIIDIKCPSSNVTIPFNHFNFLHLNDKKTQIKAVISDRADFDWFVALAQKKQLLEKCPVIVSPVLNRLPASDLASWVLESGMNFRLGLQIHKVIWPSRDRGV